jgi:hypothetical protein
LPEAAYDYASLVRVEVAAIQNQQPAQLSWIKTTQKHDANRTTYFFNSIGQKRHFATQKNCTPFCRRATVKYVETHRLGRDTISRIATG